MKVDLNDLIFFQKFIADDIFLSFDNCIPYKSIISTVCFIHSLLKKSDIIINKEYNVLENYTTREMISSLFDKFNNHLEYIINNNEYIQEANNKMKIDRNYSSNDLAIVGKTFDIINLTPIEIINLHSILRYYQKHFDEFKNGTVSEEALSFVVDEFTYYTGINYIKKYLEHSLGEKIISKYSHNRPK